MDRYSRNRIYVSEEEQEKVRRTRILLGGAGIGSVIAECALRLGFEIKMAEFVARYCTFWNMPNRWLDGMIEQWRSERGELLPPRLAVASWVVAGHCVNAMFDIITGEEVKYFPKFYFSSIRCDPA